jgi:hypothetical protein
VSEPVPSDQLLPVLDYQSFQAEVGGTRATIAIREDGQEVILTTSEAEALRSWLNEVLPCLSK